MSFWESLLYVIWRGIAIGIIISAPMGPVGILCVQRTLGKGRRAGLYTGIGAAISDLLYCLLTGFGLSFIETFLEKNQNIIQIIGSVVLIIFGFYLFRANPNRNIKKPGYDQIHPGKNILNGFLFTVSNPLIIFLIIGLFARFNFMLPDITIFHYVIGYLCIFAGALMWWWVVTFIIDKIRAHFNIRSMYMINRITGVIIMIFGIVGIATSFKAYAQGGSPSSRSLLMNSHRGYSSLGVPPDSILSINGNGSQSICTLAEINANSFLIDFRLRNLHNASGKKYSAVPDSGEATAGNIKASKTEHPGWKIIMNQPDAPPLIFSVKTAEDITNPLIPAILQVCAISGDSLIYVANVDKGVDPFTGWNAFRVEYDGSMLALSIGNREYQPVITLQKIDFKPHNIEIEALPGTLLQIDWINIEQKDFNNAVMSHLAIDDVQNSYFSRSSDPIEGVWEMYDRSLDEDLLRPGGKYRLAIARIPEGYELIYISGATKNPSLWQPGMRKGRLLSDPFKNVFTVEWLDVNGVPIPSEGKAEFSDPSILTFQFPYLNASFRLRKILN